MDSDSALEAHAHYCTDVQMRECLNNLTETGRARLTKHGHLALQRAVEFNNHDAMRALLEQPEVEVNLPLVEGNTLLHMAVLVRDKNAVRMLLGRRDLDTNLGNRRGETPIHLATNSLDLLEILGADPRVNVAALTNAKQSALHVACGLGKSGPNNAQRVLEVVRKLIGFAAVSNLRISVAQFLEKRDAFGRTALHYAAESGLEATVSEILGKFDPLSSDLALAQDNDGKTALLLAVEKGQLGVVQRLLPFEDRADAVLTAVQCAVRSGRRDVLQACLTTKRAEPQAGKEVQLFLELLAITTHFDIAIYLLEALYDNYIAKLAQGVLPYPSLLHWAIEVDDGDGALLIKHILKWQPEKANAPLDAETGRTPLHVATILGKQSAVQALASGEGSWQHLNGNERDAHNYTALDYAFESGNEPIQNMLMARHDVQQHLARLRKHRDMYVKASNAILVGSVLIATVTYAKCLTRKEAADEKSEERQYAEDLQLRIVYTVISTRLAFLLSMASTMLAAFAALPFSFGIFFVQTLDDNLVRRSMFRTRVLVVMASWFLMWSLGAVTFGFLCSQYIAPYIDYKCEVVCEVMVGLFILLSVVFVAANAMKFWSKVRKSKARLRTTRASKSASRCPLLAV